MVHMYITQETCTRSCGLYVFHRSTCLDHTDHEHVFPERSRSSGGDLIHLICLICSMDESPSHDTGTAFARIRRCATSASSLPRLPAQPLTLSGGLSGEKKGSMYKYDLGGKRTSGEPWRPSYRAQLKTCTGTVSCSGLRSCVCFFWPSELRPYIAAFWAGEAAWT